MPPIPTAPTRELAEQVTQEVRRLARAEDHIKVLTLVGGTTMRPQLASLEHGAHIVVEDLLPIGAPRRNWRQTLLSDGYLIVRHPELARTLEIADAVGTDLQIDAR